MNVPPCIVKGAPVSLSKELLETITGNAIITGEFFGTCEASSIINDAHYFSNYNEGYGYHQFMLMLQTAFFNHKAVVISPDTIWLLICQGFATHLKLHADTFRDLFTKTKEKQTIEVRRDDFIPGKNNPWEEVIPEFTQQISDKIDQNLHEILVQKFSTTTLKETIAFELTFMDAMSDYFKYKVISLCGIPEIHITGTVEDYTKIFHATEQLRSYDLDWWIDGIQPHIQQFIAALQGKQEAHFWNSIYKHENESGGPFITGWITHFFPYLEKQCYESDGEIVHEEGITKEDVINIQDVTEEGEHFKTLFATIKNPCLQKERTFQATLDDFPSSYTNVSVAWEYTDTTIDLEFISGFIGIQEDPKSFALTAPIHWILRHK